MKTINETDWNLFREQKNTIVELLDKNQITLSDTHRENLEGLLNWIDAVQDEIVEKGIKTEWEMFGYPSHSFVVHSTKSEMYAEEIEPLADITNNGLRFTFYGNWHVYLDQIKYWLKNTEAENYKIHTHYYITRENINNFLKANNL